MWDVCGQACLTSRGTSPLRNHVLRSKQSLGASRGQLDPSGSSGHISESVINNTGPQHMLCWTLAQVQACTWCACLLAGDGRGPGH